MATGRVVDALGRALRFSDITPKDLVAVGRQFGLKQPVAQMQIREIGQSIKESARQMMAELSCQLALTAGERRIFQLIISLTITEMVALLTP